jgi:hypothetical protein
MKVLILYHPNSEHRRMVEDYIRDFESRHIEARLEVLSLDTRDGSATASIYDVVRYPALLVMRDDGVLQNLWEGDPFPLIDEVAGYARA